MCELTLHIGGIMANYNNSEHIMHYEKHANSFFEALPIGNGRIGGMFFGHPITDTLILNESTMWSGSRQDSDKKNANQYLPIIRQLLLEGKNYEAQKLFGEHFVCEGVGTKFANAVNEAYGCYQVLGTLRFFFFQATSFAEQGGNALENYSRELDLMRSKAKVTFTTFRGEYTREYICSYPDQVLVARFTSSHPENISFSLALDREENYETIVLPDQTLQMTGQLSGGKNKEGIRYACHIRVQTKGGKTFVNSGRLCVDGADEAIVYISAATNMKGFLGRELEDELATSLAEVYAAEKKGWEAIEKAHQIDYQHLYKRNEIGFEKRADYKQIDLKQRIMDFGNESADYGLIELYYHYARYLLISSSRSDSLPCNLQGIWAYEIQTPWNGDWHLNAQQELYWLAEMGNLHECHIPYLKLTQCLIEPGRKTARAYYDVEGWLVHTCTNPWGFTSPCEDASWGSTTGSGAWQCHHLWEHYLYSGDQEYLKWAYPIMKEAALFYAQMLVEEPENRWLVTSPSSSPENWFYDENGREVALCMGPTYDTALVSSLFKYCIQAAKILDKDLEFVEDLQKKRKKMAPLQISSHGRIMEWLKEYEEVYRHHRHLSHLWGVYPGHLISRERTPELADAAEKSLVERGDTTAGWANAYRLAIWAKLRNPEKAYSCIVTAFKRATSANLFNLAFHCDEKADVPEIPDIENNFYPYQMDGNQGHAAGIALMLIDSDVEVKEDGSMCTQIYICPALPKRLTRGHVKGMMVHGGFEISFEWDQNGHIEGTLKNTCGNEAKVFIKGINVAFVDQAQYNCAFEGVLVDE